MMVSYLPGFPCPPTSTSVTSHHPKVRVVSYTLKKTTENILDGLFLDIIPYNPTRITSVLLKPGLSYSFIFSAVLGSTSPPKFSSSKSELRVRFFSCSSTVSLTISQWVVMKLSRFSDISQTKSIFPMGSRTK